MKQILFFIVFCIFISNTSYSLDIKRYKVKSGIIEYKIEGAINGTETVYFDDWGIKEAKINKTEIKMMGFKTETHTLTITDKDWGYNINLDDKTGTKASNKEIKEMLDGMTQKDYERFGEKMMEDMGGVKVGNESILGYNCEVWDVKNLNSKTWNYNYVPLKIEMNMMGGVTYTAVKFEANAKIPADKFSVPKGIKITEQEVPSFDMKDLQKMMQQGAEEGNNNTDKE